MIDYLPLLLTGIGIIVAIIYYTLTLSNATKARKAQLFMGLYDKYQSTDFRRQLFTIYDTDWETIKDTLQKHDKPVLPHLEGGLREEIREALVVTNSVAAYFNGVGILVSKGLIDIELVDELLSFVIINQWEILEPIIIEMRIKENTPKVHTNFEALYKEIKKRNPQ
jgi:hypothetical protein